MESISLDLACSGVQSLCPGGLYALDIPLCKSNNSSEILPHSCYTPHGLPYSLSTADKSTYTLSNLAASAHKSNTSLFYYYSHVSDTVLSISCAKRIPIPVSLESEKYQAWCSVHTKQHNPIQASELCITQACSLFQTGGIFLKKQD